MRFHTDSHDRASIQAALDKAKADGRVARTVYIDTLTEHGSRCAERAFEIKLRSYDKAPGDGRRRPNLGNRGTDSSDQWAATYDEWGWFIAELLDAEPAAVFGPYCGLDGFNGATHGKFTLTGDDVFTLASA